MRLHIGIIYCAAMSYGNAALLCGGAALLFGGAALLFGGATLLCGGTAHAAADLGPLAASGDGAKATSDSDLDAARDFDFLFGNWSVHNRRLKERLANSHEWIEFEAEDSFHPIPGGLGSEENYRTQFWKGFAALGLHLFDPNTKLWTLYWADNRNTPGIIQTLASGRFANGTGTFYAPDSFNGKPIQVRIIWIHGSPRTAHWEQAFSTDGGKTWETNWTMDFRKLAATRDSDVERPISTP